VRLGLLLMGFIITRHRECTELFSAKIGTRDRHTPGEHPWDVWSSLTMLEKPAIV
jgi:hypothetical protein